MYNTVIISGMTCIDMCQFVFLMKAILKRSAKPNPDSEVTTGGKVVAYICTGFNSEGSFKMNLYVYMHIAPNVKMNLYMYMHIAPNVKMNLYVYMHIAPNVGPLSANSSCST